MFQVLRAWITLALAASLAAAASAATARSPSASIGIVIMHGKGGSMNPTIPVLYVAPTDDYPILVKAKQVIFGALPLHPMTKLYEPDSTHLDAPSASRDEILRWTSHIAGGANSTLQGTPASGRP